ncbi:hypothetical protein ACFV6E_00210 [Streptomyces sp. NPDC059785]|uniref:hypothetical protein n=1 Tax=unclassified Streptomyces TaxID=2593676 RepID=UPI00364C16BC
MHRTTTTAALLVTVAVTALGGCTTVQRAPAPGPAPAPYRPPAPRPDGRTWSPAVQPPAREALERTGPSPKPSPETAVPRRTARPVSAVPPPPPEPRPEPPAPRPHRDRNGHQHPPPVSLPPTAREPGRNPDVCALGRKYGGWKADSPEAVICENAYGR